MDARSVELGENIDKEFPDYKYCPSDANPRKKELLQIYYRTACSNRTPTFECIIIYLCIIKKMNQILSSIQSRILLIRLKSTGLIKK